MAYSIYLDDSSAYPVPIDDSSQYAIEIGHDDSINMFAAELPIHIPYEIGGEMPFYVRCALHLAVRCLVGIRNIYLLDESDAILMDENNALIKDEEDSIYDPVAPAVAPTELYFTLSSTLTQNLYFTQSAAHGVSIDWGDGSAAETIADTNAHATHTYASAGDYVVTMTAADGVTWSPGIESSFYGIIGEYKAGKTNTYPTLTAFIFGDGCELTQGFGFYACTRLSSITIPNTTATIPNHCFTDCTGLSSFTVPYGVTLIGYQAFHGCIGLTNLSIASSVQTIDDEAFYGCANFDFVSIPSTVQTIGDAAFANCVGMSKAEIGAKTLQGGVFSGCTQLESLWLRDTVETIETASNTSGVCYQATNATIYAEAAAQPSGWGQYYDVVSVTSSGGTTTLTRANTVWNQTTSPF